MSIAETICQQFGSHYTAAMIGATYSTSNSSLTVKYKAGNAKTGNCVVINLEPDDTYSMTYYYISKSRTFGVECRELDRVDFITGDKLRSAFELKTKLATRL